MERNRLILLIIGIIIAVFVGGTIALILLYGERQRNRLAEIGDIDEELKKEYLDERSHKVGRFTLKTIELVLATAFFALFIAALVVKANGNNFSINGQSVYVVRSSSMSKLNPDNPYHDLIVQNKWNNRFDIYDMVFVSDKPTKEDGFNLGDIVVYKKGDQRIIHRIVKIDTPSTTLDKKWHYTCCGDANNYSDGYVFYDDIVGVYTKYKIPFVGVFVLWLQSSLGYVVVGIIVAYAVYSTYLEDNLNKVRNKRLLEIGYLVCRKKKHGVKYYLNDNPSASEPRSVENRTVNKNVKEPVVKFKIRDYVNMRRITWYDFSKPSKSKFNCTNYRYKIMKCLNYRYICVRVTFTCQGKDIYKYLFLSKRVDTDDIARANKCIRYLIHSGKLNSYIRYHLKMYENKKK